MPEDDRRKNNTVIAGLDPAIHKHKALEHGYWFARSAEFMNRPIIDMLVWMRVPGDTIFSVGAVLLGWFVLRQWIRPARDPDYDRALAEGDLSVER